MENTNNLLLVGVLTEVSLDVKLTDRFILFIFIHISYTYDSEVALPLLLEKNCFKTVYMENLLLDRNYS